MFNHLNDSKYKRAWEIEMVIIRTSFAYTMEALNRRICERANKFGKSEGNTCTCSYMLPEVYSQVLPISRRWHGRRV